MKRQQLNPIRHERASKTGDQAWVLPQRANKRIVRWYQGWRQAFKREEGATLVYITLILPVLLALAGLAMDGSNLFPSNAGCRSLPTLQPWPVRVPLRWDKPIVR